MRPYQRAAAIIGFIIGIVLMLILTPQILSWLEPFFSSIKPTIGNAFIMAACIIAATNPIIVGYGFLVLAAGYVFGWYALLFVYPASIVGGLIWFWLARCATLRWGFGFDTLRLYFNRYGYHIRALEATINDNPFKTSTLLQLSFLPYGIVCMALATTRVSTRHLGPACMISRLKTILYVWAATSARDFSEVWTNSPTTTWRDWVQYGISGTASIVGGFGIAWYAKRRLNAMMLADQIENGGTPLGERGSNASNGRGGGGGGDGSLVGSGTDANAATLASENDQIGAPSLPDDSSSRGWMAPGYPSNGGYSAPPEDASGSTTVVATTAQRLTSSSFSSAAIMTQHQQFAHHYHQQQQQLHQLQLHQHQHHHHQQQHQPNGIASRYQTTDALPHHHTSSLSMMAPQVSTICIGGFNFPAGSYIVPDVIGVHNTHGGLASMSSSPSAAVPGGALGDSLSPHYLYHNNIDGHGHGHTPHNGTMMAKPPPLLRANTVPSAPNSARLTMKTTAAVAVAGTVAPAVVPPLSLPSSVSGSGNGNDTAISDRHRPRPLVLSNSSPDLHSARMQVLRLQQQQQQQHHQQPPLSSQVSSQAHHGTMTVTLTPLTHMSNNSPHTAAAPLSTATIHSAIPAGPSSSSSTSAHDTMVNNDPKNSGKMIADDDSDRKSVERSSSDDHIDSQPCSPTSPFRFSTSRLAATPVASAAITPHHRHPLVPSLNIAAVQHKSSSTPTMKINLIAPHSASTSTHVNSMTLAGITVAPYAPSVSSSTVGTPSHAYTNNSNNNNNGGYGSGNGNGNSVIHSPTLPGAIEENGENNHHMITINHRSWQPKMMDGHTSNTHTPTSGTMMTHTGAMMNPSAHHLSHGHHYNHIPRAPSSSNVPPPRSPNHHHLPVTLSQPPASSSSVPPSLSQRPPSPSTLPLPLVAISGVQPQLGATTRAIEALFTATPIGGVPRRPSLNVLAPLTNTTSLTTLGYHLPSPNHPITPISTVPSSSPSLTAVPTSGATIRPMVPSSASSSVVVSLAAKPVAPPSSVSVTANGKLTPLPSSTKPKIVVKNPSTNNNNNYYSNNPYGHGGASYSSSYRPDDGSDDDIDSHASRQTTMSAADSSLPGSRVQSVF